MEILNFGQKIVPKKRGNIEQTWSVMSWVEHEAEKDDNSDVNLLRLSGSFAYIYQAIMDIGCDFW